MNKIEKMISEFCPDGVKKEKLKNLAEIGTGNSNRQDATEDGQYTFFVRSKDTLKSSSYEYDEEAIIIPGEGGIGEVFHYINDKYALHQRAYRIHVVSDLLDTKFLYHYMKSSFKKFITKKAVSATVTSIRKPMIEDFEVPLPPLYIQSEIVHILDSFILLTAELTAELTARQKQYAFYRDYLLDFSNEDVTKKIPDIDCSNVEYKRLGDIAIIERGKRLVRNDLSQEIGYPVYQNALKPLGYYTDKNRNANSVFIIGAGAAGEIGYSYVDYWAADDCFTFVCDDKLNQRYLYFLLMSKQAYLKNNVRKSSIPRLPRIALENMEIPVPPLSVQENIVKILDRFDKLNNDMSEGIPAEIEARKKQYEYYRDTLLSFDDKACSHIVKVERERERERERELTRSKAIKWLKLKELAHYSTDRIDSSKLDENTYVGVDNLLQNRAGKKLAEHIPTSGRYTKYICNDILIGNIRPYLKKIWFANNDGGTNGDVLDIRVNDYSVLYPRYLYYVLSSDKFFNYDMQNAKGAKMPRGSKYAVMNYTIPVPPLEEQERIVSILDRFDKLCNDISEGLPAEIEARQKQYEYYRDKLLNFKEKTNE